MMSEMKFHRARDKARRRILHRRELALLTNCKNSVGGVLDVELQANAAPLFAEQIYAEVKVGNDVFGQTHHCLFAARPRQRGRCATAVFKRGARPEATVMFAPSQPCHTRMNLIEGSRIAHGRPALFD